MQSSSAGALQQTKLLIALQNDSNRMKKLLEGAASSLAESTDDLRREWHETRKDLIAVRSAKTELEDKLSSAQKTVADLQEQVQKERDLANEANLAATNGIVQLRKRMDRERFAAVQEAEARWQKRYEDFKSESVVVLANSSSALEGAEGQLKQLKRKLVAAEASLQEERRQRGSRESVQNRMMSDAAVAERDAVRKELQSAKRAHQQEVTSLSEAFTREKRELQMLAAAAEAEAARLDAELAAERQRTERAQQEAKLLAAQLEQHKGRLVVALAARDRADADCAAAKAERAAAERDREAAEKVLADVVTQLDEMERQQDSALADHVPPRQALLLPGSEALYLERDDAPDEVGSEESGGRPASAAAQPRPSRDPRLAAGDSGLPEGPPAGGADGALPAPAPVPGPAGDGAAAYDHMPALVDSPDTSEAAAQELAAAAAPPPELEPRPPPPKQKPLPGCTAEIVPSSKQPQAPPDATCWLCQKTGARRHQDLGPLMHLAINEKGTDLKWLHRHCLLWSPEVMEGRGDELRNVAKAVFRGRKINCKVCLGNGATLGCNVKACRNSYHLPCALANGCHLQEWKVWCPKHAPTGPSRVAADVSDTGDDVADDANYDGSKQVVEAAQQEILEGSRRAVAPPAAKRKRAASKSSPAATETPQPNLEEATAPGPQQAAPGSKAAPAQGDAAPRVDAPPAVETALAAIAAATKAAAEPGPAAPPAAAAGPAGNAPAAKPAPDQAAAGPQQPLQEQLPPRLGRKQAAPAQAPAPGQTAAAAAERGRAAAVRLGLRRPGWSSRLAPKAAAPLAALLAARGRQDAPAPSATPVLPSSPPKIYSPDGKGIVERLLDTLSEKIGDELREEHVLRDRKLKRSKARAKNRLEFGNATSELQPPPVAAEQDGVAGGLLGPPPEEPGVAVVPQGGPPGGPKREQAAAAAAAAAAMSAAAQTDASSGGSRARPRRSRKAPERLAAMPEGPQWLSKQAKPAKTPEPPAVEEKVNSVAKAAKESAEQRGWKRASAGQPGGPAGQAAPKQAALPAKRACNVHPAQRGNLASLVAS